MTYGLCPVCYTTRNLTIHEAFVTRGQVRGRKDLIFVPENRYQVCASCHNKLQPTKELKIACLAIGSLTVGIERITHWYVDVWKKHKIPVPCGNSELSGMEYMCSALDIEVDKVEEKIWDLTKH